MTAVTIRPYRDRDLAAAARLWCDSWRSTGLAVAREASEAAMRARFAGELASGWSVWLADDATGRLVGFLAVKPATGCLDQLFVAPAAQRQGVGRALLDFARERMPNGFWLRTAVDNVSACRFYERFGLRRGKSAIHPTLGHRTVLYHWP